MRCKLEKIKSRQLKVDKKNNILDFEIAILLDHPLKKNSNQTSRLLSCSKPTQ